MEAVTGPLLRAVRQIPYTRCSVLRSPCISTMTYSCPGSLLALWVALQQPRLTNGMTHCIHACCRAAQLPCCWTPSHALQPARPTILTPKHLDLLALATIGSTQRQAVGMGLYLPRAHDANHSELKLLTDLLVLSQALRFTSIHHALSTLAPGHSTDQQPV